MGVSWPYTGGAEKTWTYHIWVIDTLLPRVSGALHYCTLMS